MGVHEQLAESAAVYALGALDGSDRAAFEAHLAVCSTCAAEVREFALVAGRLALTAQAEPAPAVRDRLIRRLRRRQRLPPAWLAAAASVLFAIGIAAYATQLRGRIATLETRLRDAILRADSSDRQMADARRVAFEAQSTVAVLAAPDLARIDLAGQAVAPQASARAFWSRSRGLVFTASNLPALPAGRTYQLWVLTSQPAPISAGLLEPDATGKVNAVFNTPPDLPRPVAMAVTLEPQGGVPAPTGDKFLVGLSQ